MSPPHPGLRTVFLPVFTLFLLPSAMNLCQAKKNTCQLKAGADQQLTVQKR